MWRWTRGGGGGGERWRCLSICLSVYPSVWWGEIERGWGEKMGRTGGRENGEKRAAGRGESLPLPVCLRPPSGRQREPHCVVHDNRRTVTACHSPTHTNNNKVRNDNKTPSSFDFSPPPVSASSHESNRNPPNLTGLVSRVYVATELPSQPNVASVCNQWRVRRADLNSG